MEDYKCVQFLENLKENLIDLFEPDEAKEESFRIKNTIDADWAFKKIRAKKEEFEEKKNYILSCMARYEEYLADVTEDYERSVEHLEFLLTDYAKREAEKNPKFKLKTAEGSVVCRHSKKWNYDDEKVIAYLKNNDLSEFVRIKEEVNKSELKKAMQVTDGLVSVPATGEIIDGITVTEEENYSVSLK